MEVLPRLTRENATQYMPPDLRRSGSRDSAAASEWYQQMVGQDWDGSSKSYEVAKKRHRRLMCGDYSEREREREGTRGVRKRNRERDYSSEAGYKKNREYKATYKFRRKTHEDFHERREKHTAELEQRKAERKERSDLEKEQREAEMQALRARKKRLEEHFFKLLTSAGVAHAELFLGAAFSHGFTNPKKLEDVCSDLCLHDESRVEEYLHDHVECYVEHLYEYRGMLARSEAGRAVLTGGRGWDPLRTGAMVRHGELPPCFAPSGEHLRDETTVWAAEVAELQRMPSAGKFARGGFWHLQHVMRDVHSNPECREYYSRLSVGECKRVCAECCRSLGQVVDWTWADWDPCHFEPDAPLPKPVPCWKRGLSCEEQLEADFGADPERRAELEKLDGVCRVKWGCTCTCTYCPDFTV